MRYLLAVLYVGCCTAACDCAEPQAIEDIAAPPPFMAADLQFADVFKLLDGRWRGQFRVLVDKRGQAVTPVQPEIGDGAFLDRLPLREELVIDVEQSYMSETPYFQRVTIKDTYRNPTGEIEVIESRGANKVQGGQLWCVVQKPDETVVHRGHLADDRTIIWQRNMRQPLKIEYFRETVREDTYSIVGWGYYGQDDPARSPRYWFRASYQRIRE